MNQVVQPLMISCFQAVKTDNKLLFEHKSKFLLVHSSSGFKHSLKEVSKQHLITSFSRLFLRFYKILQFKQNWLTQKLVKKSKL